MIQYYVVSYRIQPGARSICTNYILANCEFDAVNQILKIWPFMELISCISEEKIITSSIKIEYKNWNQYIDELKKVKL